MRRGMKPALTLLTALLLAPLAALNAALPIERSSLVNVELDADAFAHWQNGSMTPISAEQAKNGPAVVVWTSRTEPHIFGMRFGDGREPGVRHLRIGFAKHGGCLDLMLALDPNAKPDRTEPAPGDQRLLITQVKGKTRAFVYRARVPGIATPVPFSSPHRTIQIDVVSDEVQLATNREGHYEISVPLSALHWQPKPGAVYRADVGLLRGANGQTTQRVYWSNKATASPPTCPAKPN